MAGSTYFTISLDPSGTNIQDANLDSGLENAYINSFSILLDNPFDSDGVFSVFERYYTSLITPTDVTVASTAATDLLQNKQSVVNNVVQIDMDGNLIISNSQPSFAATKEESKNILGSVEKISDSEILIADSINKRAIIVDTLTQAVKWQYDSDRYVVDAHAVLVNSAVIKIDSDYIPKEVILNKGQSIVWENDLDIPITIYSGDISRIDNTLNFDVSLYGDLFKSIVLNKGDRWSYTADQEGEASWFSYPNGLLGKITVSNYKISPLNEYVILESDGLESPFTGRAIKVDCWGNILWTFGEGYLVKPRDARPLLDDKVVIST